jgi:hypothetical protein
MRTPGSYSLGDSNSKNRAPTVSDTLTNSNSKRKELFPPTELADSQESEQTEGTDQPDTETTSSWEVTDTMNLDSIRKMFGKFCNRQIITTIGQ